MTQQTVDLLKALADGAIARAEEAQARRRVHWSDVARGALEGLMELAERRAGHARP